MTAPMRDRAQTITYLAAVRWIADHERAPIPEDQSMDYVVLKMAAALGAVHFVAHMFGKEWLDVRADVSRIQMEDDDA